MPTATTPGGCPRFFESCPMDIPRWADAFESEEQRLLQIDREWSLLKALHVKLTGLHPDIPETELHSGRKMNGAWEVPELRLAGSVPALAPICHWPGHGHGQYIPRERSLRPTACIWVDSLIFDNLDLDHSSLPTRMTEEAWRWRVALPYNRTAVTLLHEFAHHIEVLTNDIDLSRPRSREEEHGESWEQAYTGLIRRSLEARAITRLQADLAGQDLDEVVGRIPEYGGFEPLWLPGPASPAVAADDPSS